MTHRRILQLLPALALCAVVAVVLALNLGRDADRADAIAYFSQGPFSFTNDSGLRADGITVEFTGSMNTIIDAPVTAPAACVNPALAIVSGDIVTYAWPSKCIGAGEKVAMTISAKFAVVVDSFTWENDRTPIYTPTETGTPTRTPVTTDTPTPTDTSTPSATPDLPSPPTSTPMPPTDTPIPPIATATATPGDPFSTPGDANCNGRTDAVDAALVLQLDAALIGSLPCEAAADVDGNGQLNSIDAAIILQFIANLIDSLPV